MTYQLHPTEPQPCPHCGRTDGWHVDINCPAFSTHKQACFTIAVTEQGVRRCSNPRGFDVHYRLTRRGQRHFHQYTGDGIYCEHHARSLAVSLNARAEEVA